MGFIINHLSTPFLFLFVWLVGILAVKLGAWVKGLKERKLQEDKSATVGSLLGALLGLLAFMLGFTFSITASRFSERKHLVVKQSQAIGVTYLRTQFLPDSQRRESQKIIKEYTDILIASVQAITIEENIAKLESLEARLWQIAVSLKDENLDPHLRSLYVSSVNEVVDVFAERKTVVLIFKIPAPIWSALLALFICAMFVVGLENSTFQFIRNLNIPIMTAAFALIVTLISAMDASTRAGQFSVNQQPLVDVQHMIKKDHAQYPR